MKRYRYLSICVFKDGSTLLDAIWASRDLADEHVSKLNALEKKQGTGDIWSVKEIYSYE